MDVTLGRVQRGVRRRGRFLLASTHQLVTDARHRLSTPGDEPLRLEVDAVRVDDDRLLLDVRAGQTGGAGGGAAGARKRRRDRSLVESIRLQGPRQRATATEVQSTTRGWQVTLPLVAPRPWDPPGAGPAPLWPGDYRLQAELPVRLRRGVPTGPDDDRLDTAALRLRLLGRPNEPAGPVLRVGAGRPAAERGEANRERMQQAYHRHRPPTTDNLVYLVSFEGRATNDNPAAIGAELLRREPGLELRWGVAHRGLPLPDGARGVLLQTEEWWDTLARARLVVSNCWLPKGFEHRRPQLVLQTWHGTPYKRLGLDRPRPDRPERYAGTVARHAGLWDLVLAQNEHCATVLRRAYGYAGELPVTGYPRNDALARGYPTERLAALRNRLGLRPGSRTVLYAPTFRDGESHQLPVGIELDRLPGLLAATGQDVTVLLRGHTNTSAWTGDVRTEGVVDVSAYPDVADLFAVADVLVTDYSSTMFDFAVTGRPIVFFVPDLEQYAGSLRGVYFDLAAVAPGPLVTRPEQVAEAVAAALDSGVGVDWTAKYADWQRTYLPHDDGGATARVVDLVLARL